MNTEFKGLLEETLRLRIARELVQLRKRKSISQGQLSMRSGLDLRYIKRIEAGEVNLTLKTLGRILEVLKGDMALLDTRSYADI